MTQGGHRLSNACIMNLFTVSFSSIPLARPLSYSLRNEEGVLLARKGHLFFHRAALLKMAGHGTLCVDMHEIDAYRESMAQHNSNSAEHSDSATGPNAKNATQKGPYQGREINDSRRHLDWLDLQSRTNALLRLPTQATFLKRLHVLQGELLEVVGRSPDTTLLALIHLAAEEDSLYSATHALLVGAVCSLTAREVLDWPEDRERALVSAALTMNISMTELQDQLLVQTAPLSIDQRDQIDSHAQRSVAKLQELGVTDPLWLGAIDQHHTARAGAFATKSPTEQVARLIHRADVFIARLSPRASRRAMASLAAKQSTYFDEKHEVDDAGTSIIKALGIHHPGSLVTLATGEVAIVIRRAKDRLHPIVAVLLNRHGIPLVEPVTRDTSLPAHRIVANVNHAAVKIRTDLLRVLAVA